MKIKSFKINHRKLKPGIYLHDVQQIGKQLITTFDLRFKIPNRGDYLSNSAMHSLEHIIATFYSTYFPEDKIYFGPMGCQTGFYLLVAGKKDLKWLEKTFVQLNTYINTLKEVPGANAKSCGNYVTLNLTRAQRNWNQWYNSKARWCRRYEK